MNHVIDAKNRTIGRVASEAAMVLMGKNKTSFAKNIVADVTVTITNAAKTSVATPKLTGKTHVRYSGYPGGLKRFMLAETIAKKGFAEVYRKAVKGMLPKNKLQAQMMKNLVVTD
jgi:large subunit ribosomal protein L13